MCIQHFSTQKNNKVHGHVVVTDASTHTHGYRGSGVRTLCTQWRRCPRRAYSTSCMSPWCQSRQSTCKKRVSLVNETEADKQYERDSRLAPCLAHTAHVVSTHPHPFPHACTSPFNNSTIHMRSLFAFTHPIHRSHTCTP